MQIDLSWRKPRILSNFSICRGLNEKGLNKYGNNKNLNSPTEIEVNIENMKGSGKEGPMFIKTNIELLGPQ